MLTEYQIEKNKNEFLNICRTNITRPGINEMLEWLENSSDFFRAPSSTQYHGCYPGGLCEHSLNVYKAAKKIMDNMIPELADDTRKPENITEENLVISALFHDLCKVNYYDPKVKWFKDESNNWHSYQSYEINDRLPLGHGEKSVILLQQFIRLTGEEIASIRWHMAFSDSGTWISIYEKPAMMKSLEICPLVMVIAMADQFATFLMEKREDPKVCCLIS